MTEVFLIEFSDGTFHSGSWFGAKDFCNAKVYPTMRRVKQAFAYHKGYPRFQNARVKKFTVQEAGYVE